MAQAPIDATPEAKSGVGLARREIHDALSKGKSITCPCCDRTVGRTERSINRSMVEALRTMRDKGPVRTKDMPQIVQSSRDHPRLSYWGLAERDDSGFWRITAHGEAFLRGDLKVARFVYIFADEVIGRTESDVVSVHDCTDIPDGKKFAGSPERAIGGLSDTMIKF